MRVRSQRKWICRKTDIFLKKSEFWRIFRVFFISDSLNIVTGKLSFLEKKSEFCRKKSDEFSNFMRFFSC